MNFVPEEPAEPFDLIKSLGSGQFAQTYQARVRDEDLVEDYGADHVVLKIPLDRPKERVLQRELELNTASCARLGALKSPYLCRNLGFAVFQGRLVMVMEYFPDGSLQKLLGPRWRGQPLGDEEAVRIAKGVLMGLEVIHREGFFHGNLKPENILMDGQAPKLSDFGVIRMMKKNEMASSQGDTIFYMSPEMLEGEGVSCSSDLWAFGVILHQMVTGNLPFGDENMGIGGLFDLIRNAHHRPACEVRPGVPRWLSDVIEKALQRRSSDRFPSASEILAALERTGVQAGDSERDSIKIGTQTDPHGPTDVSSRESEFTAEHDRWVAGRVWAGEKLEDPTTTRPIAPVETAFHTVDVLQVQHGTGVSRIELCVGDLSRMRADDAVDVLVVSAFPDSYEPAYGSLIAALERKGVRVADLALQKEVDLRQAFSCWISRGLSDVAGELPFRRILCFEPLTRGTPAELVGDIFRSLAPFVGGEPPVQSVATPLVASGYQLENPEKMLRLLVEAAVHWMRAGMPLSCLKIACLPGPKVSRLRHVFEELKRLHATVLTSVVPGPKYDVFISYAHVDSKDVSLFESTLVEVNRDIRLFIDRKDLNPGAAWQQEIYESLDSCRKIIAFLTPAYLNSKVCLEEFNIALCRSREADQRILVPVYLYSANLPTYMKLRQFWDCRESDATRIRSACTALAEELTNERRI
jgi:serine/threonine protein kinase